MNDSVQLTILMPCLNEAETIAGCIEKAKIGLQRAGVSGEILIADNGSTDGSQAIAEKLGVRVVAGEGKRLRQCAARRHRGGPRQNAFSWATPTTATIFPKRTVSSKNLPEGYDLVMGCRLPVGGGTILPGAMPWKNRWIGNPALSFIGRLFFKCPAHDFHAGLRAFTKDALERMDLQTTGMEFASEMVIKATLKKFTHCRGAHHAAQGRTLASAASEAVARWLAAFALHADLFAALAVSHSGAVAVRAGQFVGARLVGAGLEIRGAAPGPSARLMMACMAVIVGFPIDGVRVLHQSVCHCRRDCCRKIRS